MQREGGILMKRKREMREAFSMITAIFVIVLMATVSVLILRLSSTMTQETTAQYQHEETLLYAKSYTDYAIMAITANDRNDSTDHCLENINGQIGSNPDAGDGYKIQVRISYLGSGNGKGDLSQCSSTRRWSQNVQTPQTPLSAIIDVYVEYRDPNAPNSSSAPWITYHHRTIQKI